MDSALLSSAPPPPLIMQHAAVGSSFLQQALLGHMTVSSTQDTVMPMSPITISDDDKLDLFEEVLDSLDQGGVQTTADPLLAQTQLQSLASDTAVPAQSYPAYSSGRAPEQTPGMVVSVEVPGLATVEVEPQVAEIPVEVEGFLERVAEHPENLPQEIVLNGNDIALNQHQPPKQAIVIVPITQEDEQLAKGKNSTWSIAWLVEWSHKVIKRFLGKAAYRPSQPAQEVASS